ncbi:tetratricopeptide repeat protein [Dactylosporangium sp. NBC_01737]|uniref:tetratricopeptide repeat protein n=1 Tax=Dactylosporangium sp. NBC_01737 TaxID=2975959 RepID=UPI002E161A6A|nr:tetratricopeptide repeat protein [Dactylosporangium sp. NBC_01737]
MSLTVTESTVRLVGAGVDVSAAHGGVRPGLANALYDVRLERTRQGDLTSRPRGDTTGKDLLVVDARPGLLSLRRAGELLAESFLPEPVEVALRELLERAVRDFVFLRIGVDAPGLARLPWEALPDPITGQPLALHPQVAVYRRTAVTAPSRMAGPLRIVVAIASPDHGGGALLDYEHELRMVLAAVQQARQHQARIDVVPFATTSAIRAALDVPGGVHVLHISAHGRPGALILEDEAGAAREVTAEQLLTEAIPPGRMPPVLALAACYTDVDGEQQGTSFAAQLAARGVCAVIGTQTSVTDRYATRFFARVYAELAASADPDVVRAVCDARRLVQRDLIAGGDRSAQVLAGMDEWGVVTVSANAAQVGVIDHSQARIPAPPAHSAEWGQVAARPVGQFVGRRDQQRHLPAVLAGNEDAGLVLHGIGGIGKTTLAAEVLRRAVNADPAWRVVSLYGPVTPDLVLAEVGAVLRRELLRRQAAPGAATVAAQVAGRIDVPWQDRLALLHDDVLGDVPVLLVLDNFEDNLDPDTHAITDDSLAQLLATWVMAPARSRLVVTSRHPIALPGGAEGRLRAVPVGPLSAAETGKLLWSLPHIDRHATTGDVLEQVWRLVGGHPRSLEYLDALLGGGQARFADITARLEAAAEARLGPERSSAWLEQDRTLDAAVADTVTLAADDVLLDTHLNRLTTIPGAVEVLMAASVYREPVPSLALTFHIGTPRPADQVTTDNDTYRAERRAAAEQITALLAAYDLTPDQADNVAHDGGGPLTAADRDILRDVFDAYQRPPQPPYTEPADLTGLLEVLRDSSLLHLDPAQGVVFMHRWTATELQHRWQSTATLDPGKDPIRRAHLAAAAYWLWRVKVWPQDQVADLHDREEARHHLIAAGDLDAADTITGHIYGQLTLWGAWDRATALIHDTLRWLPTNSPSHPGYTHSLGNLAYRLGDFDEAERCYQQSLTILEQLGDQAGIANSYGQLGMLAQDRGNYAEAERRYQQSLTIFEQLGNQTGIATSYHQLGILAHNRGNYTEAERRYQQSLTIKEQLGNQAGIATSYHQLGMLAQDRGNDAEAERRYQQSLTIKEQLGDQSGIASSYHHLGMLAQHRGDYTEAERRYQQSLIINEQLGNQASLASSYHQLGILAQLRGDYTEAERRYQQSLTIEQQLGNQAGIATSYAQLGNLHATTGDPSEAIQLHVQALSIRLAIGLPQAANNITRLTELRERTGHAAFAEAARQTLDDASYTNLIALLDARTPDE